MAHSVEYDARKRCKTRLHSGTHRMAPNVEKVLRIRRDLPCRYSASIKTGQTIQISIL